VIVNEKKAIVVDARLIENGSWTIFST
jgi:hypothetical protein